MTENKVENNGKHIDRKWLILSAVMLGSFMGPMDGSIVNTVLPNITKFFKSDISIAQWVPTIYLLTISCLILLYGRLGDMIGYKKIYICGLAGFTAASALCGFSQSMEMLIVFRAIQGLAAGMIMSVGFAIITSAFPRTEIGEAMGIYAISIAAALGLGPTFGGIIAEYLNWRYIFFINVPIGIVAMLCGRRMIPGGIQNPGQKLDWAGALLAFAFLSALLFYANRGEAWGWTSGASLALLGAGLVCMVVFFRVERMSKQPMLNLALFRNRRFSYASVSALLNFVALFGVIFLTPFYMFFALHYNILQVGLVMASAPVATLFVAPVSGKLSDRIGIRGLMLSGMVTNAIGIYLLAGLCVPNSSADSRDIIWRLAIVGLGCGIFQSPNNSAIMGSVPLQYLGIASGILAAMRNVGMTIGVAVAGAVLYAIAPVTISQDPSQFSPADTVEFIRGLRWAYNTQAAVSVAGAITSVLSHNNERGLRARKGGPC